VPDTCLQFWGGMGYTWENKVSRMFRDGRLASIGGGADEVISAILSKIMGIAKRPLAEGVMKTHPDCQPGRDWPAA